MRSIISLLLFVSGIHVAEAACSDDAGVVTVTASYRSDGTYTFSFDRSTFTVADIYCALVVTSWSGAAPLSATYSADLCTAFKPATVSFSPRTTNLTPFLFGTVFSFEFRKYADVGTFAAGAGIAAHSCASVTGSLTPTACGSDSITWVDSDNGEVTVSPTVAAGANVKCKYTLNEWDGTTTPYEVSRISNDCSPVTFRSNDVVDAFTFAGTYRFTFQKFAYSSSIDTDLPICGRSPAAVALVAPVCDATKLVFARPDELSVSVTVATAVARAYMLCRITLKAGLGAGPTTTDMVRVGSCTDTFEFISGAAPNDFDPAASGSLSFTFEQFPSGDLADPPSGACSTTLVAKEYTIAEYATGSVCDQALEITRLPGADYSFKIAAPHPLSGTCTLTLSEIATVASTSTYELPSCGDVVTMNMSEITSNFEPVTPGQALKFKWSLASAGTCTSLETTAFNVDEPVAISAVFATGSPGTITVTLDTVTSVFAKCRVRLVSCDGNTGDVATTTPSTDCDSATVMTAINVPASRANCIVKVEFLNTAADTVLTTSDPISIPVAAIPSWTGSPVPTVSPYGEGCLLVSWDAPTSDGGSPVTCYKVYRKDGAGEYYVVGNNCDAVDASFLTATSFVSCTFAATTDYKFQVQAVNRLGVSVPALETTTAVQTNYLLAAPASTYVLPTLTEFAAGSFPMIRVQLVNPTAGGATETSPNNRLFVGRLLTAGTMDATGTILTASSPRAIATNSPPAFTKVFVSVGSGLYDLVVTASPLAGAYSLATYSLESGGLVGHYYENPFLVGSPSVTRKDPIMNFSWGLDAIIDTASVTLYDLVSVRWSGFVEADFTEEYTFFLTTSDKVRMWVDDVIIINQWKTPCALECSGRAELLQSVAGFGSRRFHHVRIEYSHSKGPAQDKLAALSLSWASFSQARQVVPAMQLFKGALIVSATDLKSITIVPDVLHTPSSVLTLPVGPYIAGKEYTMTIQAKDQYGNSLTNLASSFVAVFSDAASVTDTSSPADPAVANGLYEISFVLTVAGSYSLVITGSDTGVLPTETLTVVAAVGYDVATVALVGTPHYAGTPVVVSVDVNDQYGNALSNAATVPDIYVNAAWTGDAVTEGRLVGYDDFALRRERFGDYFTESSVVWNSGTSKYDVSITLPRAGTYTFEVGIVDGDVPDTSLGTVTLLASQTIAAQYSIVVTKPFPPTFVVGTLSSVDIQLRDKYLNGLGTDPSPMVTLSLEEPSGDQAGSCGVHATLTGQYTCTVTPDKAGTDLYLSIKVNDVHAAYIAEVSGEIRHFVGPWAVAVTTGTIIGTTTCAVVGARAKYQAGVVTEATVSFSNGAGNVITSPGAQTISFQFNSDSAVSTSYTPNSEGVYTIPVKALLKTSTSLAIIAAGITCSGTVALTVSEGVVGASQTSCAEWAPNTFIAGTEEVLACTLNDLGANTLTLNTNRYKVGECKLRTEAATLVAGTYDFTVSPPQYKMTLNKAGQYSCYFLVGQPGGLIGQYYSETDFTELVGVDNTPIVDARHHNEPPLQYTRIDSYLDFDWGGPIKINDITVKSIKWTGVLVPQTAGHTSFTITIVANGGVKLTMSSAPDANFDLLGETTVSTTTVAITYTQFLAYPIEIQYKPVGNALFTLEWTITGGSPVVAGLWTIPPSALHAPLSVLSEAELNTVSPTTISASSIAILPSFFTMGVEDTFTIQAIDQYDNYLTADVTACLQTGTLPACLFSFALSPDDGTTFTVTAGANDGKYTVTATFATDGPKSLTVNLIESGPTPAEIAGSPYTFDVLPSS